MPRKRKYAQITNGQINGAHLFNDFIDDTVELLNGKMVTPEEVTEVTYIFGQKMTHYEEIPSEEELRERGYSNGFIYFYHRFADMIDRQKNRAEDVSKQARENAFKGHPLPKVEPSPITGEEEDSLKLFEQVFGRNATETEIEGLSEIFGRLSAFLHPEWLSMIITICRGKNIPHPVSYIQAVAERWIEAGHPIEAPKPIQATPQTAKQTIAEQKRGLERNTDIPPIPEKNFFDDDFSL